jgi:hypothetical protein
MPHFTIESNDDGTLRQILKDGRPHEGALRLEQLYSAVTIYFKLALMNLECQRQEEDADSRTRPANLKGFLTQYKMQLLY